ncbi:hypothetical protein N9E88_03900 [Gammaproteobacteria bacterium]|nr:hypothetical protein [Gammaproteobacteria bacterium]MDA9175261.1 hypothetical protein [Gammaproteobacteria bacterium]MDA9834609.1 hypothetical protein [Gammaproteobacteria bacterium]MDA9979388.1 hypothetical protein [Gammaproteobacteria bacterium]MDC3371975.1 hypothetical protein [Gammaproteobacteria bacterium]
MENKKLTIPNYQDQISPAVVWNVLKNSWKFISIFIALNICVSVMYSLNIPNTYTSIAKLELVDSSQQQSISSGGSQFGELGSFMGMDLGGNNESALISARINSRFFALKIANLDGILPNLMAAKGYDFTANKTLFHSTLYDESENKWNVSFTNQKIYERFRSTVLVSFDQKSQLFSIAVKHVSPIFAYELLQLVLDEINLLSRENAVNESEESIAFLKDQLSVNTQANVILSINALIESQLKAQMLAYAQKDFLLKPVDPAYIPDIKSGPQRAKIVILWVIFSIIGVMIFLVTKDIIWVDSKSSSN